MVSMIALFRLGRKKQGSCAAGASRHASCWDSPWVRTESSGVLRPGGWEPRREEGSCLLKTSVTGKSLF